MIYYLAFAAFTSILSFILTSPYIISNIEKHYHLSIGSKLMIYGISGVFSFLLAPIYFYKCLFDRHEMINYTSITILEFIRREL